MILQALTQYYETLRRQDKISVPGWNDALRVSFGLELDGEGRLLQLISYRQPVVKGKKTVVQPTPMRVPMHVVRTSGVAANFLCDTSAYLMGADEKGKPDHVAKCFAAAAALHRKLLEDVPTEAAQAVLRFFDTWQSDSAPAHPLLAEAWKEISAGANLIFCYHMEPVINDPAIEEAWQRYYDNDGDGSETAPCLVTGKTAPIAALHPSIKGVRNASTMGASLVSFNAPAFESYGHSQGMNAPVSRYAAFAYTTALNYLLADSEHCRLIGDTTVVCWALHGENVYQDMGMMAMFGPPKGVEEPELRSALEKLGRGERCEWHNTALDPQEHFCFLGLSPNSARLSVRFFLQDTFGDFIRNVNRHYTDIAVVRPSYDKRDTPSVWSLLAETVNPNARDKAAQPQLAGEVMRSVLTGAPYPATLLMGAMLRVRSEKAITPGRAGIIKGYYLRAQNKDCPKEVLKMELNENSSNIPYTLGRLFSVLEQIQQAANPGINTTIKDKYFNSASGTPALIFPTLGNLAQKHLRVLRAKMPGAAVNLEKKLGEFSAVIGENYPTRLNLPEQGSFQLGYYFENQKRYQKKEDIKEVANHE